MIKDMFINKQKMLQAAASGYATATDVADWLVKKYGFPFRKTHKISGKMVKLAINRNCELKDLDLSLMRTIEPKITKDIYYILDINTSIKNKNSFGGTAPKRVNQAIKEAKKYLVG